MRGAPAKTANHDHGQTRRSAAALKVKARLAISSLDVEKVGAVVGVWGLNSGVESVGTALIL